jgi:succinate-semialdehyde dehydrogenase / glutarate-semialdehyde dehydrogenase
MTTLLLNDSALFRQQAYISGRWCEADNGASFRVTNPATGEVLAQVPDMGAAETRRAIEAAKAAWPEWRHKTARERANLLRKWHDLMMANLDDLARLMTAEQGKPLAESKGEISYAASFIEWFAEEGKRVYGDTIPSPWNDRRLVVVKEPVGVCCAITPWNSTAGTLVVSGVLLKAWNME